MDDKNKAKTLGQSDTAKDSKSFYIVVMSPATTDYSFIDYKLQR